MRCFGIFRTALTVFVLGALLSVSCTEVKPPVLSDAAISSVRVKGLTSAEVELTMTVENPNRKSISVESLEGTLRRGDADIAGFSLADTSLEVPAASVSTVVARLSLSLTDPMAALAAIPALQRMELDGFLLDARAVVSYGGLKKKLTLDGYPAGNIVHYVSYD